MNKIKIIKNKIDAIGIKPLPARMKEIKAGSQDNKFFVCGAEGVTALCDEKNKLQMLK